MTVVRPYFWRSQRSVAPSMTGTSGAPTAGYHPEGEILRSTANDLWICTAAGKPGAWGRIGPVVGTDVQAHDNDLDSIAALSTTAFGRSVLTQPDAPSLRSLAGLGSAATSSSTEFDGAGAATAAQVASQPLDSDLTAIAALSTTSFGRGLLALADAAALRSAAGLVIGTDVQAQDVELAALAGLTSAADRVPYFTGSGTASTATVTSFIRGLLDDTDAATARTTLGLGSAATAPSTAFDAVGAADAVRNPTLPTGANWQSVDRQYISLGSVLLVSGRLQASLHWLPAGLVITTMTFYTGASGAVVGPQNQWAVIADASRNRLAVSAGLTTTAWGNGAAQTYAFTPYTIPSSGLYYVGLMMKCSGTAPTVICHTASSSILGSLVPVLAGTADTGLSTPATCPSTLAALSAPSFSQLYWLSA